eukprot:13148423-Ditylum_brightwellii.AAC.1
MMIAKDCLREAIQLVPTKRPPIAFKIKEESMMYKLCMQLEEDNSPVYSLTVGVCKLGSPKE